MSAAGVTHRALAERSGVPLTSLQAYLGGHRRMPAEAVPRLAKALGVSCDYLLTGEPAALDPGITWQSLNDMTHHLGVQVSEERARGFYGAYTMHYLERLSSYGRAFPYYERAQPLMDSFSERMETSGDALLKHLRQLFPEM